MSGSIAEKVMKVPSLLEQTKAFYEPQLEALGLGVLQIENQTLEELEQSLEGINIALTNPSSFGVYNIAITVKGTFAITTASEAHAEIGILPILL